MVAGRNTAADGIIRLAGAENAQCADFDGYKPINDEAALAAGPDVVLGMNRPGAELTVQEVFANPEASRLTPPQRRRAFYRHGRRLSPELRSAHRAGRARSRQKALSVARIMASLPSGKCRPLRRVPAHGSAPRRIAPVAHLMRPRTGVADRSARGAADPRVSVPRSPSAPRALPLPRLADALDPSFTGTAETARDRLVLWTIACRASCSPCSSARCSPRLAR